MFVCHSKYMYLSLLFVSTIFLCSFFFFIFPLSATAKPGPSSGALAGPPAGALAAAASGVPGGFMTDEVTTRKLPAKALLLPQLTQKFKCK